MNIGLERKSDLREQHKDFLKEGYDGHNRRSGLTTMHDLRLRKARRTWNMRMRTLVSDLNFLDRSRKLN